MPSTATLPINPTLGIRSAAIDGSPATLPRAVVPCGRTRQAALRAGSETQPQVLQIGFDGTADRRPNLKQHAIDARVFSADLPHPLAGRREDRSSPAPPAADDRGASRRA